MANPYAPPTSAPSALPLRAATAVLALDAARSLLWRGTSALAMAYPHAVPSFVGSLGLNLVIQLAAAVGIAFAVRAFDDRRVQGIAIAGALAYVLRLVLDVAGAEYTATDLGPVTMLLDAAVAYACCAFIARTFAAPRARVIGVVYVIAAAMGALVNANAVMSLGILSSSMSALFRTIASLTFIVLAIAAYQVLARIRYDVRTKA